MEMLTLLDQYGITIALIIFIAIQSVGLVQKIAPNFLISWQESKLKEQAHKHDLEVEKLNDQRIREASYQDKIFDLIKDHQEFLEETSNKALENKDFWAMNKNGLDNIDIVLNKIIERLAEHKMEVENLKKLIIENEIENKNYRKKLEILYNVDRKSKKIEEDDDR